MFAVSLLDFRRLSRRQFIAWIHAAAQKKSASFKSTAAPRPKGTSP
jgi:hypothetical protein